MFQTSALKWGLYARTQQDAVEDHFRGSEVSEINQQYFAFACLSIIGVSFHDPSTFVGGGDYFGKSELYVCVKRFTAPQLSALGECHL